MNQVFFRVFYLCLKENHLQLAASRVRLISFRSNIEKIFNPPVILNFKLMPKLIKVKEYFSFRKPKT